MSLRTNINSWLVMSVYNTYRLFTLYLTMIDRCCCVFQYQEVAANCNSANYMSYLLFRKNLDGLLN